MINNLIRYDRVNNEYYSLKEIDIPNNILIPTVSITLAENPEIYKEIANIYNSEYIKNKLPCISSNYNNELFEYSLTEIHEWGKKIAEIYQVCIIHNDYKEIINLGEKCYYKLFQSIKNDMVNFNDIIELRDKKEFVTFDYIVAIYILKLKKIKVIVYDKDIFFLESIISLLYSYKDIKVFKEQQMSIYKQQILDFKVREELNDKKYSLSKLNKHFIEKDKKKYELNNDFNIEYLLDTEDYINLCDGLLDTFKMSWSLPYKTIITDKEIDKIILNMFSILDTTTMNKSEWKMYIIFSLYMLALCKEYKGTKDKYIKENNEKFIMKNSMLKEMKSLELRHINEIKKTSKEIEFLKKENVKLDNTINSIRNENIKLKSYFDKVKEENTNYIKRDFKKEKLSQKVNMLEEENKRLYKYKDKYEELIQENTKLREYIFKEKELDDFINDKDLNVNILKGKKIIILGGTTQWINKMREKLPEAIFPNLNNKYSDLDFIDRDSYIFINTNISHSFYYKIKSAVNKINVDYYYIKDCDNINYSLKEMIDILNNTK